MLKFFKNFKTLEFFLVFFLLVIFFTIRLKIIDYGLPFFQQEDENAFLKSTIVFLSFISGIKPVMNDPVFAPFVNLILSLKFIFINEFILDSYSFNEIKQKIYNDPSILILYGRYNSLLLTTLGLFLIYLIFKKLKINFIIYFPLLVSISYSLFTIPISLSNGKNSYYFFLFLLQLYFFIKYYFKLEKFNTKSYFLISFLASMAWSVNYWGAIVSFYGILILHYKKFRFQNFQNIFYFIFLFLIIGFIPNLFNFELFFDFFLSDQSKDFSLNLFLINFFKKFFSSIQIVFNTEKFLLIYFLLFGFFILKRFKDKNFIIIITFLFFEPILIIAVADQVIPELRYFSGLICLMFILSALMIKQLSSYYNSHLIIYIFLVINLILIFEKIYIQKNLVKVISKDHSFVQFYENNQDHNSNILYLIKGLDKTKNYNNLIFYKNLHEKNIIRNKLFQKDNYNSVLIKIEKEKKSIKKLKNNKMLNLNLFNIDIFEIKEFDKFFDEAKKQYKFVGIQENIIATNELYNYIRQNYKKIKYQNLNKNLYFNNGLRDIIKFLYNGGSSSSLENFVIGNHYSIYSLEN